MEPISLFKERCSLHGDIYFIEYLPKKTLISQQAIDTIPCLILDPFMTLTILGENGIATYELQPLDEENYYGTFVDWHLYEPPVTRHFD